MKHKLPFLLLAIIFWSCQKPTPPEETTVRLADNMELAEIYENDQNDRRTAEIDWSIVGERDALRQERVHELLDSGLVKSSKDYYHAAMIFQHGWDSIAYGMAVKLMRKSIELDSNANKWLLAASIDRDLLSRNKPQIYGTQFRRQSMDQPWEQSPMDTTQITDAERIEYGVETLAEQKAKVIRMNLKKLDELTNNVMSVDEIISIIKKQLESKPVYDFSERAINGFGYDLMAGEKYEDALKIFRLNTEIYPEGFNTYDSYGECLLILDRKEEAIAAYKKSLELNPENDNAKKVLEELEE